MFFDRAHLQDRPWRIYGRDLSSRFILGTANYPSPAVLKEAICASGTQMVTVGLRRQLAQGVEKSDAFFSMIKECVEENGVQFLPNTAGCYTAHEAIQLAHMARELFKTKLIKVEVIGDAHTLQPDPFALLEAVHELLKEGFEVLPYCTEDLVLCTRLVEAGCEVLMPWGSPIGSGQGLLNPSALTMLRNRFSDVLLIVDAGLRSPSDAAQVLEIGFDGVLLNTAVAQALNPPRMARAFKLAVEAGREAFESGIMTTQDFAVPSTPVLGRPFLV
jgi:thiazole synthase